MIIINAKNCIAPSADAKSGVTPPSAIISWIIFGKNAKMNSLKEKTETGRWAKMPKLYA
jgi:hypothetical protein